MLAIRKTKPAPGVEVTLIGQSDAALQPHDVELAVRAAGICGSDLHAYNWDAGYAFMREVLPVTVGHEFTGEVIATGAKVKTLAKGDRVVCWPTVPCGTCSYCRADKQVACINRSIIGLHRDGGFAGVARVPEANCFPFPEGVSFDRAALAEPLSVAVTAVDRSDMMPRSRVVVLGPGPIGLFCAWVAQARGARVLLVGLKDAPRLELARAMGISHTADLENTSLEDAVAGAFGQPVDRVIEATGVPVSIEQGLDILAPTGILVVAGIHAEDCRINLARFVREKKELRGTHDTTERAFREALGFLQADGEVLEQMITHRFPLSRGQEAFDLACGKSAMKVLLIPEEEDGR